MILENFSTYGDKERDNILSPIEQTVSRFDMKKNNISRLLGTQFIDFTLPLGLLGLTVSWKIPQLPKLPDISLLDSYTQLLSSIPTLSSLLGLITDDIEITLPELPSSYVLREDGVEVVVDIPTWTEIFSVI